MKKYTFDFSQIEDQPGFYRHFTQVFQLEKKQVHDLDSLWDVVVGGTLPLPGGNRVCSFTRDAKAALRGFDFAF